MAMSGKTLKAILLAGTIVFCGSMLFAAPPHLAQATDGGPSVAKTSNVNSDHEPEAGTIDEAGQKVGEKIEQFETRPPISWETGLAARCMRISVG